MPRERTILSVAYALAPVGCDAVGGAEQVLAAIDEALVRAGHRSIVVACEGSRCHGLLVPTLPLPARLDEDARGRFREAQRAAVARVLDAFDVDVVHLHGIDFADYLPASLPTVVTLHLPTSFYPPHALDQTPPNTYFVAVSNDQRRSLGGAGVRVIPNGIDLRRAAPLPSAARKEAYALALGRICPEKGFHLALDAAKRAGMRLVLAGQVYGYEDHERYFREEIAPRLDADRRFIGPVGGEVKRQLIAAATCVVIPSLVAETSSLVAMEALACGTPVVARPVGALREIIEVGRTGFLVESVEEMAERMRAASAIAPEACRAAAEARFDVRETTRRYLDLYEAIAAPRASTRAGTPALQIACIRGRAALERLHDEWAALWDRCPTATPFQRPEWLLAYSRAFCSADDERGAVPFGVTVRANERLVGLGLFCDERAETPPRVLSLGASVSDYLDALFEPDIAQHGATLVLDAIARERPEWERCELLSLEPESPLLRGRVPEDCTSTVGATDFCPRVSLPATLDELARALPAPMMKKLRYYRRRAEAVGARVERARAAEVPELVEALFRLHEERWQCRGHRGVLASEPIRRMHREAAPALAAAGVLRMYAMRIGGREVAILYGFAAKRRVLYYLSGFASDVAPLSPGVLLIGCALEDAIRERFEIFDFLRGQEGYKYAWGASDVPIFARSFTRSALARPRLGSAA